MTPPGSELTDQCRHRRFPNLTWRLSCDQCAQDEVPRAQEPVPAFGFGRKVEELFPEDRRGNSREPGKRCVPGHGNSMCKGPVEVGEGLKQQAEGKKAGVGGRASVAQPMWSDGD